MSSTGQASSCWWVVLVILILVSRDRVLSLVPVHPDAEEIGLPNWRSHLGPVVRTRLINPALCHDMTEEECLDFDRRSIEAARRLAVIYRTTGYLRVPVVLMRFTDHVWREQPTPENYDFIFNSWEPDEFWTPAGSVKRFLKLNAQEHMEIDFDIMPWKTTNGTELYYSFNRSGITTALGAALNPVLDQLEDDKVDWTLYDQNGDGKIDAMLVLHSGYQAEVGNFDCYSGANFTYRIWSHAITSAPNPWVSPSTGIKVDNYAICGGHRGVCQNKHPYLGVITHEFLHLFGLPDLNDNSGEWIGKGLGSWSIMSNPFGANSLNTNPSHMTPWERMFVNWLDPIEIVSDGTYSIGPMETTQDIYIIKKNFPEDEYLLIENRQPIEFDALLWGGGLLIWHIDNKKHIQRERGYPGQEGWPGNNRHYEIALMAADGKYDLETGANGGDDGDYYRDGMELGPGPVEQVASENGVYPNTNSYQDGIITQTGIRIYDISKSQETMTFSVEGLGTNGSNQQPQIKPPTKAPTKTPTKLPTPAPTKAPTYSPTQAPTKAPTRSPTQTPTKAPTRSPTKSPTPTLLPVDIPVGDPGVSSGNNSCRPLGTECDSFLQCCSLRCFVSSESSYCVQRDDSKAHLKLARGRGGAAAASYGARRLVGHQIQFDG